MCLEVVFNADIRCFITISMEQIHSRPHRKKKQKCFFFFCVTLSPARGLLVALVNLVTLVVLVQKKAAKIAAFFCDLERPLTIIPLLRYSRRRHEHLLLHYAYRVFLLLQEENLVSHPE